ncbi:MAG: sigma-70 family RNA polymerase sigma factor [Pirellulaceae bacterium]|nr:sigma-70 family RNA polymerase sigma factor [Pirellulaceae bacterium]
MSHVTFDPWPNWLVASVPAAQREDFVVEVVSAVLRHTRPWIAELKEIGPAWRKTEEQPYAERVARCLMNHWERFTCGSSGLIPVEDVLVRLERGDLGYERTQSNVIREVILAQALEQGEPRAAEQFEEEYMPLIRNIAQRTTGKRGLEWVENFLADLVLPRDTRPPRISGYVGRTSLASWLRVVVMNHCREAGRKKTSLQSLTDFEPQNTQDQFIHADDHACIGLLQPIFTQAVSALGNEDRLLIKLLVLDDVPQHTIARQLKIHSGNVTRRRQRISQIIWAQVQKLGAGAGTNGRFTECMELVLAGHDVELRRSLGDVLAHAVSFVEEQP